MSTTEVTIDVAKDFSPYPAGRDDADGPFNGTKFRNEILRPKLLAAIAADQQIIVSLDGVKSFGSSFLEEAFGGLVRSGISKDAIRKHLRIVSSSSGALRYLDAIARYIKQA